MVINTAYIFRKEGKKKNSSKLQKTMIFSIAYGARELHVKCKHIQIIFNLQVQFKSSCSPGTHSNQRHENFRNITHLCIFLELGSKRFRARNTPNTKGKGVTLEFLKGCSQTVFRLFKPILCPTEKTSDQGITSISKAFQSISKKS